MQPARLPALILLIRNLSHLAKSFPRSCQVILELQDLHLIEAVSGVMTQVVTAGMLCLGEEYEPFAPFLEP